MGAAPAAPTGSTNAMAAAIRRVLLAFFMSAPPTLRDTRRHQLGRATLRPDQSTPALASSHNKHDAGFIHFSSNFPNNPFASPFGPAVKKSVVFFPALVPFP